MRSDLKFWERAAFTALGPSKINKLMRDDDVIFGVQQAHGMRYVNPATLGDSCEAVLEPLGIDAAGRLAMKAALVRDGKELCTCGDLRFGFASRSTTDGLSMTKWPMDTADLTHLVAPEDPCAKDDVSNPPVSGSSPPLADGALMLQLDEASCSGALTLHAALRYFERHRTTYLGGPSGLQALADSGVSVVVGRVNNLRLLDAAYRVGVGDALELRCRPILKARNTQILFEQWLTTPDGTPLARGDVACVCLDAEAGKMCPAPLAALKVVERYMNKA